LDRVEEQRLIATAQRGDTDAFAMLYRENVQAIFRYVYHRVNDYKLAEDITGDVFIKSIEGLPKYQDAGNPFLAWLYRIAHARVVDYYRQQGRRPVDSDLEDEPIPVEVDMDESLVRQQATDVLREAIITLTEDQQQVIRLRFIEGHRIEAVANLLGKNANAIKALQHRALRTLATRLERAGLDVESILAGLSS